jgi:hypothetical protein
MSREFGAHPSNMLAQERISAGVSRSFLAITAWADRPMKRLDARDGNLVLAALSAAAELPRPGA